MLSYRLIRECGGGVKMKESTVLEAKAEGNKRRGCWGGVRGWVGAKEIFLTLSSSISGVGMFKRRGEPNWD